MNPFDFLRADNGGSLMPIVIFVIWIAVSMIAGVQKRKKKQQQIERSRSSEAPKRGDVMEELKHQLETVFAEKEQTSEEEQPLEMRQAETDGMPEAAETLETDATYDRHSVEYNSYEEPEEQPPAAPVPAEPPAMPAPMSLPAFRHEENTVAALMLKTAGEEYEPALSLSSLDDARSGVLWAEVLGPPVSLRE